MSPSTVSRVLNTDQPYTRPTFARRAARIRQAAKKLGYRPNASARAMRAGEFGTIALVLSAHSGRSYLPQQTLEGICDTLGEQELHLTIARLPDEKLTDAGFVPRIVREYCCDGMLIDYTDDIPAAMIELIESLEQPLIWLNRKHDRDCVYPDDVAIGRRATQRLLSAGHRRIAYVDRGAGWKQLDQAHYSQRDRQTGYVEAMSQAGLRPRILRRDDSDVAESPQDFHRAMVDVLGEDDRPTAFVTYSRVFAQNIAGAAMRRGLSVPADVSLVTVSYQAEATAEGLGIDCVLTPTRAYGIAGVQAVLARRDEPGAHLPPKAIAPVDFYEGQTVAPPRADANEPSV
ncbi:MAG: LacI family DNA-binding transcriptional regulator [Phycisphaerae bacterium]|nr:LacI family DNA-binding transcriptional regulator [Phycisphaerae bacterium]